MAQFIEQISSILSFFSQLPTYKVKPRPMMKSSRNLAGSFSMQTYSRGKPTGNPLGDGTAVMPLETKSKTLYDFNFHYSRFYTLSSLPKRIVTT